MNALKGMSAQLKQGEGIFLYASKDITADGVLFRPIVPETWEGNLFKIRDIFWIGKKSYVSAGKAAGCVLHEEYEAAQDGDDEDAKALLDSDVGVRLRDEILIPGFVMKETAEGYAPERFAFLSCGKMLADGIIKALSTGKAAKEVNKGNFDGFENGATFLLTKEGQKMQTRYHCKIEDYGPIAEDAEGISKLRAKQPDYERFFEEAIYPSKYLRAIFRHVVYGEAEPAEVNLKEYHEARRAKAAKAAAPAAESKPAKKVEEKAAGKEKAAPKGGVRSVAASLEETDDDEL